jgi:hypothetical protein
MARVLMKCPETGVTVSTCQRMKSIEFDALERELGFRCPSCDKIHKWSRADAWLEESPASAAAEAQEVLTG